MRTLFGIAIIAVALVVTTWSVRADRRKNPHRFRGPTQPDGHYEQSTTSALPRFQHHLLTDRAFWIIDLLARFLVPWLVGPRPGQLFTPRSLSS